MLMPLLFDIYFLYEKIIYNSINNLIAHITKVNGQEGKETKG